MSYQVRLENFEGPFDLLFHLIERAEIDIYDIPIAKIAREYLEYLAGWEDMDIDAASEFLLLASRLIEIKAKTLLPKKQRDPAAAEVNEIDPRAELVEHLLEYKLFRRLAVLLGQAAFQQEAIFTRTGAAVSDWFPEGRPLEGVTLADLSRAFRTALKKVPAPPSPQPQKVKISIAEKAQELCQALLNSRKGIWFRELFRSTRNCLEVVVTFLALLEMIHQGRITACQTEAFGDILIIKRGEW